MKKYAWILTLSLLFAVFAGDVVAGKKLTMGVAIDKAGSQRMLTQRMIKAYALVGLKLKVDAVSELARASELFDRQLYELTAFSTKNNEKQQLEKITLLWGELKKELQVKPSQVKAGELNDLAELLLQESHRYVGMLESRSGKVAGKLVNKAGRQRMLSQRLAKIYLLETWGLESDLLKKQYSQATKEFSDALTALMASKSNASKINTALEQVHKNWRIFGISDYSARHNVRVPSLVVRSMDKILKQMDEITGMYAKLK